KAPGTRNSTTFRPLKKLSVQTSSNLPSRTVVSFTLGILSPTLIAIRYPLSVADPNRPPLAPFSQESWAEIRGSARGNCAAQDGGGEGSMADNSVTPAAGTGSRQELIDALNEDLSREYQAIIAYVVYSQVLKGAEYMSIAKEL